MDENWGVVKKRKFRDHYLELISSDENATTTTEEEE